MDDAKSGQLNLKAILKKDFDQGEITISIIDVNHNSIIYQEKFKENPRMFFY